jgi:amino acid permease
MHPVVFLKHRGGAARFAHAASPALSLALQPRGGGSVAPGAGVALASLLMKNMIGAGIFALFSALTSSNTGLLPGIAILAAVATASAMSFELLGEAAATSSNGNVTTTELWQDAVGGGAWLIGAATFLQGFTCLVQFSATLTDLLVPFAPGVSRTKLTLASGVALVP